MSISLFVKKKKKTTSISFFIKKKKLNVLDSWHIYGFILQVTFWVFIYLFFFLHFLYVELVSGAALTSK